jgi:hypothetical protein
MDNGVSSESLDQGGVDHELKEESLQPPVQG